MLLPVYITASLLLCQLQPLSTAALIFPFFPDAFTFHSFILTTPSQIYPGRNGEVQPSAHHI